MLHTKLLLQVAALCPQQGCCLALVLLLLEWTAPREFAALTMRSSCLRCCDAAVNSRTSVPRSRSRSIFLPHTNLQASTVQQRRPMHLCGCLHVGNPGKLRICFQCSPCQHMSGMHTVAGHLAAPPDACTVWLHATQALAGCLCHAAGWFRGTC